MTAAAPLPFLPGSDLLVPAALCAAVFAVALLATGRPSLRPRSRRGRGASRVGLLAAARRSADRGTGSAEVALVAGVAAELATLLRAGVGAAPAWQHAAGSGRWGPGATGEAAGDGGGRAARGSARARSSSVEDAVRAAAAAAGRGEDVAAVLRRRVDALSPTRRARAAAEPLLALAAAWQVAERAGAPPAEVLERLGAALLADRQHALARQGALAGPRASALVLAVLPLAGLGLGVLVGVDPVAVLLGTAAGRISALVGVTCAVCGWGWTRLLVRAAERVG